MNSTFSKVMCWIAAALLLALSAWSCNLAAFNWFAADFHDEYRHVHELRGNIFFCIALASLTGCVTMVVLVVRRWKRRLPKAGG